MAGMAAIIKMVVDEARPLANADGSTNYLRVLEDRVRDHMLQHSAMLIETGFADVEKVPIPDSKARVPRSFLERRPLSVGPVLGESPKEGRQAGRNVHPRARLE